VYMIASSTLVMAIIWRLLSPRTPVK
jgi:hypothetical protein